MGLLIFVGLRTEPNNNNGCCYQSNNRCNLCTVNYVSYVYHSCKYRSSRIAAIALNIHKNALYVKLNHVLVKGSSRSRADVIPVRIEEPTRKQAIYKDSSIKLNNCINFTACLQFGLFQPAFIIHPSPLFHFV
jgi:hypothetical protein